MPPIALLGVWAAVLIRTKQTATVWGLTRTAVEFMQLNGHLSTSGRGSSPGMVFQLILRMVLLIPADGDCPTQTSLADAISIATFQITSLLLTRISAPQCGLATQRSGLLMRRAPLLR